MSAPNSELVSDPTKPPRLKIISAHWGVEGALGGDPDKVDCLLEKQTGNIFAARVCGDLFHGSIPTDGKLRLKVKYSFDGHEDTTVRQDGEFLMLPEDPYLRAKLDIFSPLQIDALALAKELRNFGDSLPPYPSIPAKRNDEPNGDYMVRYHTLITEARPQWERQLSHGYANRDFGRKIASIFHRAGEEYDLEYPPDMLSRSAEIGPSFTSYGITKLAQEMEMVAIWINRKERKEVDLLHEKP
jgi:hypothetical protein